MKQPPNKIAASLHLSAKTWDQWHTAALRTGTTMPQYLENALITYLDSHELERRSLQVKISIGLAKRFTSLARSLLAEQSLRNQFRKDNIT